VAPTELYALNQPLSTSALAVALLPSNLPSATLNSTLSP
jgi:hypothetical protein